MKPEEYEKMHEYIYGKSKNNDAESKSSKSQDVIDEEYLKDEKVY